VGLRDIKPSESAIIRSITIFIAPQSMGLMLLYYLERVSTRAPTM